MDKYNQIIVANSISMSYNEFGEGFSPIIFIHGFPFDKNMWQPQVGSFKNIFHLITYDIRGFGMSKSEEIRTASIDIFAEDLIALMDALHIEKAVVCGFSMGGYILLNAIKRFPDRFSAIILAGTQCIEDTKKVKEGRKEAMLEIQNNGFKLFAKSFISKIFCQESFKNKKELVDKVEKDILSNKAETVIATLNALANRSETCATLNQIEVPTLIICGIEDLVTPIKQAQFLKENIPNSILKIIKNAGHIANMEQPIEFNAIINDFISNLPHLSNIKLYGNENLVVEPKTQLNITSS